MKKILFSLFLFFGVPIAASAHSVVLSWTGSTTTGAQYHVFRAPCAVAPVSNVCPTASEGTFVNIASAGVTATTFTDSTVVGNTNYSYYVTAFCPAGACPPNFAVSQDSAQSNHVGAAIPPDPVTPPSGLNVTTIAMNFDPNKNQTTFSATYTDPQHQNTWQILDAENKVLANGVNKKGDSTVTQTFDGAFAKLTFSVCDVTGCTQQVIQRIQAGAVASLASGK